jgi:hypothetical protein
MPKDISSEWHPTLNGNLKLEDFPKFSKKKAHWRCPLTNCKKKCFHDFYSIIGDRNRGSGCPYCSGRLVCICNSIEGKCPEIAKQWHPIKNEDILPSQVSVSSGRDIWWLCEKTCSNGCIHEYKQRPADKIGQNHGCPYCVKQKICIHESLGYMFPDISKEWHPTKNGEINPEAVSPGSKTKYWWKCLGCKNGCIHEWEAAVGNRIGNKSGCPYCISFTEKVCRCDSLAELFPSLLSEWDPKNDIDPYTIPPKSAKTAKWICKNTCSSGCICNHSYEAVIHQRTNGTIDNIVQCPKCKFTGIICKHTSVYSIPLLLNEWHPTKNGNLKPEEISMKSGHNRIWWKCSTNPLHEWETYLFSRVSMKTGCPNCVHKTEVKLLDYLKSIYPTCESQFNPDWCKNTKTGKHLPFDVVIEELKKIIELDGPQHFQQVSNWGNPEDTMNRDIYKMKQATANGYKVIRIYQPNLADGGEEWLNTHLKPYLTGEKKFDEVAYIANDKSIYDTHIAAFEPSM